MRDTIKQPSLGDLIDAGAVRSAHVIGQAGVWFVSFRIGMGERVYAGRDDQPREFRKLDTVVKWLKGLGVAQFDVDAANYDPDALPIRTRPDRARAMKRFFAEGVE